MTRLPACRPRPRASVVTLAALVLFIASVVALPKLHLTAVHASAYAVCFKECGRDRSECLASECGKPPKRHCADHCYEAFENCVKGCESLRGARTPRE
jgi:hypothetical protein